MRPSIKIHAKKHELRRAKNDYLVKFTIEKALEVTSMLVTIKYALKKINKAKKVIADSEKKIKELSKGKGKGFNKWANNGKSKQ